MNPTVLASEIEERYRRYLKTTFYFKDPDFRASFEEALNSGHLSKGPFLEATPVFKRGQTPRTLFQNLLGLQSDEAFLNAVQGDRPLYQHQEEAIQGVFEGSNVIVATGTGSGKTEAFLYPILIHLYQEFQAGDLCPGVRALILYPMNALANDQRERLGEICLRLKDSPFRFTFGQYIGETPVDENDSKRHARDHIAERHQKGYSFVENGQVVHGELVLRSEMRKTPPHVLLTNYSMLEYLLLRPDDSPLLDNGQAQWWTFLVLDEAHQYRGSRGIEMAMLLRRLKRRLREGGRSEPFRCIATSATLVSGQGHTKEVAKFAFDLFGEKFSEQNVILGETETIPEPGPNRLSPDENRFLGEFLQGKSTEARSGVAELASRLGVSRSIEEDRAKTVGLLFQRDKRATELRQLITGNPAEVQEIANQVFGELPKKERVSALSLLVELLLQAKDPSSDVPLLSARYHLFLRSLEGAFVSYWPQKKVFLDRKAGGEEHTAFEVALCRECGQHYLVGQKDFRGGKLVEAIRDPSHLNFGATFLRPIENGEGEDEEGGNGEATNKKAFQLCVQCGEMRRDNPQCGHNNLLQVVREKAPKDEDRADQMARCGACGYNAAGHDPVREVVHGTDGPHAVIATTLYQTLPEMRKKVLAFSDSRQEAAFFAWYLEDSYKDILSRNLVLKIARSFTQYPAEGISLYTIADRAFYTYRNAFKEKESDDEPRIRKNIWRALYREFLTDEQRISLEGVGLVRWSVKWPNWFRTPEILRNPPWSLTESESWNLLSILLDSMRGDRAVELQTERDVSLNWGDLRLQALQMCFRIGRPARPKGVKYWPVRSWDGVGQWNHLIRTQRTMFLAKILMNNGMSEDEAIQQAAEALREIWEVFSNDRLLPAVPKYDARRVNPDWWRLHPIFKVDVVFQCDVCGRLQTVSVHGICPRHRCPGTLKGIRVRDLESNHYRLLYEANLPGSLRVEEHTAQLDKQKARDFQREFREGKIHVLSCSTTFELGVDLGNLDTIFLRNVPPEAFNYAQRVGRAGRRSGYPGFAITYCRRGPHDLYHFSEPQRMLSGRVRPPVLSVKNEKIITRHLTATALSQFFRDEGFSERFKTTERLFKDFEHPSGVADFKAFLEKHRRGLEESLRAIVPANVIEEVGLGNGTWIDMIAGDKSRFSDAEAEVSSDYQNAISVKESAKKRDDFKTATWAVGRLKDIADNDVLSFLSRKAVIPKYGFPVDVVELDTQRTQASRESTEVSLQRDLAIAVAEFAPTSKLVANKKEWTSYGLKRVAGKEWPRWWYARCATHNRFERSHWLDEKTSPHFGKCCDKMAVTKYVDPKFGFMTNLEKPKEPRHRSARVFTTRPYFAGFKDKEGDKIDFGVVNLTTVSPGYLVVLCEGRRGEGFYICGECGGGFRRRETSHKTPYGQSCRGTLEQVSLGHEFVTDVVQLQFDPKPEDDMEAVWFAYSLAYAMVEGAASERVLEVPSNDLSATVGYGSQEHPISPIILYDNVPGGAGLVARLEGEEVLKACLEAAQKRVSGNCGCDENTSCYGCLRSYRNQFAHQYLQRGPVMRYLQSLLSNWRQASEG